jgi:hypothetical protein
MVLKKCKLPIPDYGPVSLGTARWRPACQWCELGVKIPCLSDYAFNSSWDHLIGRFHFELFSIDIRQ